MYKNLVLNTKSAKHNIFNGDNQIKPKGTFIQST